MINIKSVLTVKEVADMLHLTSAAIRVLYAGNNSKYGIYTIPARLHTDEYRRSAGRILIASAGIERLYNIHIPFSEDSKESLKSVFTTKEIAAMYKVPYQALSFYCRSGKLSNNGCRKAGNIWLITRQAVKRILPLIPAISTKKSVRDFQPLVSVTSNIRVDVRDKLQKVAEAQGKSLSGLIADIINDAQKSL